MFYLTHRGTAFWYDYSAMGNQVEETISNITTEAVRGDAFQWILRTMLKFFYALSRAIHSEEEPSSSDSVPDPPLLARNLKVVAKLNEKVALVFFVTRNRAEFEELLDGLAQTRNKRKTYRFGGPVYAFLECAPMVTNSLKEFGRAALSEIEIDMHVEGYENPFAMDAGFGGLLANIARRSRARSRSRRRAER